MAAVVLAAAGLGQKVPAQTAPAPEPQPRPPVTAAPLSGVAPTEGRQERAARPKAEARQDAPASAGATARTATQTPALVPDQAPASQPLMIALGKAHSIELPAPVRDVIVANPEIADTIVKTPTQIYVVAKKIGTTNIFFIGADRKIVLHLVANVDLDLEPIRAAIAALLPEEQIELKAVNGSVTLSGLVRSAKSAADAASIARRFVDDDAKVVNLLRVTADQQVLLQVRIAEVSRNVVKRFGVNTTVARQIQGNPIRLTTPGLTDTASEQAASGTVTFNKLGIVGAAFTALERQGLVKTLAEPALAAVSGETASFLVGGEIPTPSGVDSQGNLIIDFREFGVNLSFTPVVLADNHIRLRIDTEVSRQATENRLRLALSVGTVEVTGRNVRRAGSTVTLPTGGNLMIAGLLQNDEFNTIDSVPWVSQVPILGLLFRSPDFQANKTELVVLVTAHLVRPVEPEQRLALPTDGFAPGSDLDIYVLGQLHKRYAKGKAPSAFPTPYGAFGYIME